MTWCSKRGGGGGWKLILVTYTQKNYYRELLHSEDKLTTELIGYGMNVDLGYSE